MRKRAVSWFYGGTPQAAPSSSFAASKKQLSAAQSKRHSPCETQTTVSLKATLDRERASGTTKGREIFVEVTYHTTRVRATNCARWRRGRSLYSRTHAEGNRQSAQERRGVESKRSPHVALLPIRSNPEEAKLNRVCSWLEARRLDTSVTATSHQHNRGSNLKTNLTPRSRPDIQHGAYSDVLCSFPILCPPPISPCFPRWQALAHTIHVEPPHPFASHPTLSPFRRDCSLKGICSRTTSLVCQLLSKFTTFRVFS